MANYKNTESDFDSWGLSKPKENDYSTKNKNKKNKSAPSGKGKFFVTSQVLPEQNKNKSSTEVSYGVSGFGVEKQDVILKEGDEKQQIKNLHKSANVSTNTNITTPLAGGDDEADKSSRKSKTLTTWRRDKGMEAAMSEQGTNNPVYFDKKKKQVEINYEDKNNPFVSIKKYDRKGELKNEKVFSGDKFAKGIRKGSKNRYGKIEKGHSNVNEERVSKRKNTGGTSIWNKKNNEKSGINSNTYL